MIAAIAGRDRSWLPWRGKHRDGQQAAEGGNRQQDQGAEGQQGDKRPAPGVRRGGALRQIEAAKGRHAEGGAKLLAGAK